MRTRKVYTVHLLASARPTLLPGQTRKPTLRLRSLRYPLAMHFLLVAQFLHSLLFTWFTTAHKSLIYALIIIIPIRLKYGWIFQFFSPSSKPMVQILYTSTPLLITHFHICTYFSENFHLRIGSQFWLEFPIKIYIIHTSTKLLDENEREREREWKWTLFLPWQSKFRLISMRHLWIMLSSIFTLFDDATVWSVSKIVTTNLLNMSRFEHSKCLP